MRGGGRKRDTRSRRYRGAVVALVGLMLPVMVGMMAMGVDLAVLTTARAQMQTTTDAAALAAAKKLASERRLQGVNNLTPEIKAAQTAVLSMASSNRVLGDVPVFLYTSGTATGADIQVGYLAPSDTTSVGPDSSAAANLHNSVRVFGRRDATHGGPVPGFFGQIFGVNGFGVQVSSTATAHPYEISGFKATPGQNASILPIVLHKTNYDQMMKGTSSDQYTYNPTTKTVSAGPDGVKESMIFPIKAGSAGNWGTINLGVSSNSTSVLGNQIRYGVTEAQLKAEFPSSGGVMSLTQTDNSTNPPTKFHTFSGDPGISAGIKDDLASIIGKPVAIPVYDNSGGNGNNAWYRVIGFGAVRIVHVDFKGNPKYVIVQPALLDDSTAIKGNAKTNWNTGGLIKLFLAR